MSGLALALCPSLEMGALQAVATVVDPDVRLEVGADQTPEVRFVEGVVDVRLCFPDGDAVDRFLHRVAALAAR